MKRATTTLTRTGLNQVELWFSKIERDVIARGVFTSLPDLKRRVSLSGVVTGDSPEGLLYIKSPDGDPALPIRAIWSP